MPPHTCLNAGMTSLPDEWHHNLMDSCFVRAAAHLAQSKIDRAEFGIKAVYLCEAGPCLFVVCAVEFVPVAAVAGVVVVTGIEFG